MTSGRQTWRPGDDQLLRSLRAQGLSITEVAGVMGRSYKSVHHRLSRIGDRPATCVEEFRFWLAENLVWKGDVSNE